MGKKDVTSNPFFIPFYYGWVIVIISALTLFFSGPGQTYSISIFIDYYIEHFNWNRSLVSSLYSGATLASSLFIAPLGKTIDSYGHRIMIPSISILLAFACIWMSLITSPIMLLIGFFLLRLSGQGGMRLLSQTLPSLWFSKNRGFILSLTGIGGVIGAAIIPLINNYLIQNYNIPFSWRFWAVLLVGVMANIGWIFVRNRPSDIGVNISKPQKQKKNFLLNSEEFNKGKISWTLAEAQKTTSYWLMIFCVAMFSMISTGTTFHLVSIINQKGYSAALAASLLSIRPLLQFPVSLIAGKIYDIFPVHLVKSINYIFLTLALLFLYFGQETITLYIYAGLFGLFLGFEYTSNALIWPNYYGKENLGIIQGTMMTTMVLGSSLGPLPFGIAYDITNSYNMILIISLFLSISGVVASYLASPPKRKNYTL